MRILILHGSLDRREHSTEKLIVNFLVQSAAGRGMEPVLLSLAELNLPFFDPAVATVPQAVERMCAEMKAADAHLWFTPLYHGSMTGALKNALDWVEVTRRDPLPYLTGKIVGLSCLSDGLHALEGIHAMNAVAKSLRAWVLPFSVPILKMNLFQKDVPGDPERRVMSQFYCAKLDKLVGMLSESRSLLQLRST